MSYAYALSIDFRQASSSLRELLEQLQADISALNMRSSNEVFQGLKQKFLASWKSWEGVAKDYKKSLKNMPKELRRRRFIKELAFELEVFEVDVKSYIAELKEKNAYLIAFQSRLQQITESVSSLDKNPLIQKFLRGETVMASRKNIQWQRKVCHASLGMLFLYLFVFSGFPKTILWSLAGGFILWTVSLETIRHLNPKVNDWVCRWFKPIMRERERTKINSAMFYIVAMLIVYFVFPIEVTMLAMLFIALGDPVAGVVGVFWGKRKLSPHSSLEGSLACFATCALMAYACAGFLISTNISLFSLIIFSILSGLTGAIAEASFKKLDDNLVMPLLSAPILWGLMKVFSVI